jgi:NAD+ diphosphatase
MAAWHGRHRFCANCGAPSRAVDGGWKRVCGGCQAEHFPRTDPVVIMLAVHQDRCLVARNPNWPERMFSALAGFVEPGETIEEACARELHEEAGLTATGVRYLCSQPWPYPSSLMVGLIAEVASDVVTPDVTEVQEHHWLTRAEVRAVLAGDHADIRPVSKLAIARTLLDAWVEA